MPRSRSRSRDPPAQATEPLEEVPEPRKKKKRFIRWYVSPILNGGLLSEVEISGEQMKEFSLSLYNGAQLLTHLTRNTKFEKSWTRDSEAARRWQNTIHIMITYYSPDGYITVFEDIKLSDKITDALRTLHFSRGSFKIRVYYYLHTLVGDDCSFCWGKIEEGTGQYLSCGHGFHKECIPLFRAETNLCPVCRQKSVVDAMTFQRRRRRRTLQKSRRRSRRKDARSRRKDARNTAA